MSTLEWRRDQPRARAPRDPAVLALQIITFSAVSCNAALFVAFGDWWSLATFLVYGYITARSV